MPPSRMTKVSPVARMNSTAVSASTIVRVSTERKLGTKQRDEDDQKKQQRRRREIAQGARRDVRPGTELR